MPSADVSNSTLQEGQTTPSDRQTTRLYISPFDASLCTSILGPSLTSTVTEFSFHILPTFLDKPYGYVTLPTTAALALRKKLNGAHLRGYKMRVEEARPDKKRKHASDRSEGAMEKKSKKRDQKHPKLEGGTLPAIELEDGRSIKRGWSRGQAKEGKAKASKSNSKGAAIIRVRQPIEAVAEDKNSGGGDALKKKKRLEVTEFEKTTKFPTFLRDKQLANDRKGATAFVEGKGWVDEEGQVLEPASSRRSARKEAQAETGAGKTSTEPMKEIESVLSVTSQDGPPGSADSSSSSIVSSSSESSEPSVSDDRPHNDLANSTSTEHTPEPRKRPSKSSIFPSTEPSTPSGSRASQPIADLKPVHPLEALFKRPSLPTTTATIAAPAMADSPTTTSQAKSRPAPIDTSFSFGFDNIADADVDSTAIDTHVPTALSYPQTPFTRQDLEDRGIRSAAPTPDTAAIGRRFSWRGMKGLGKDEKEEEDDDEAQGDEEMEEDDAEDDEGNQPIHVGAAVFKTNPDEVAEGDAIDQTESGAQEQEQTAFEKHFYAHRGEYNRAWKQRKREARKEVRQAENRRVGVGR